MTSHKNPFAYLPTHFSKEPIKLLKGFASKKNCTILVYYEEHNTMEEAILREKQIKGGSRKKRLALVEQINPNWKNLCEEVI